MLVNDVTITSDQALFKDPPPKEDCPICFLPMPINLMSCVSLPPATISCVPNFDYAIANEELQCLGMKHNYSCCGKSICKGCLYSSIVAGDNMICPFCKTEGKAKTGEDKIEELMKRVEANDADAMYVMGTHYYGGAHGLQQNQERAMELWKQASQLGSIDAHYFLGNMCFAEGGNKNLKKAKFHLEPAAMAGHEVARYMLGFMDFEEGKKERAVKHWIISASAGNQHAMHQLRKFFEKGVVNRNTIDSTLTAYNNSCAEMRSEASDTCVQLEMRRINA